MASIGTAVSETGESIVPDSTTTNLERMEEFNRGQDILYKAKDGKYYLGTVAELDPTRERCLVKFADGTDSWALFKQLERLSAPTPPPPPVAQPLQTLNTTVRCTDISTDAMYLRMCVVCNRSAPTPLKEIVLCYRCGRGYHAGCHVPTVGANIMRDEKAYKWLCRRCYGFDLTISQKTREIIAPTPPKIRGPDKNIDLNRIGIPKETLATLKDLKLPYNLESLSWDPTHRYNLEQRYCYCGLNGDWTRCMLQCGRCRQWFHAHCIVCMRRPLYAGDQFYVFVCAICHRRDRNENDGRVRTVDGTDGEPKVIDEYGQELEFIRRLEMKWVDLIHLMLFNLTTFNSTKYFDLDSVLIPYIRDNWHGLQLPLKIANCSSSERRNTILTVLTTNRNRFKLKLHNSTGVTGSSNTWGLRVRLPPPASAYILPPNQRISERVLKQHWTENRRIEFLDNPPIGSEFTMGGLLVTRATIHCDKVGAIMRGAAYLDSVDSEVDDFTSSTSTTSSNQSKTSSTASQTMLRQRVNPVQYAPGSVKKSASTVAPGNKKVISQGKGGNKATLLINDYAIMDNGNMREWNNKSIRDRNLMNNNETQTAEDSLFLNKSSGGISNKHNKKRMLMKRNETRKLLRRKCRMEQERNKTGKRRTRLSLDARLSSKSDPPYLSPPNHNHMPPTPPTSISDPPTPPTPATTDYNTCSGDNPPPLTRANLSDLALTNNNTNTSYTSGDETSCSKSTLDLIIPPPKDFEGRNNPFSTRDKVKGGVRGGGGKGREVRKGGNKNNNSNVVTGAGRALIKRQLSAKDIRIGPNGEVKRRRIRRSLLPASSFSNAPPVPASSSSSLSSLSNGSASSSGLLLLAGGGVGAQSSGVMMPVDDGGGWMPTVGSCVEYVLNGRRLRVRQEKQLQQHQVVGEEGGGSGKKGLVVLDREGGSVKASPVKTETAELYSMDDLKSSVSSYFGAATRIAAGERYTIRARRIGPSGIAQYLIEWDGTTNNTNIHNPQQLSLHSTPPSLQQSQHSNLDSSSSSNYIHNPYYNRTMGGGGLSSACKLLPTTTYSSSNGSSKCKGGKLSMSLSGGSLTKNVATVLTLDSLRTFKSEL